MSTLRPVLVTASAVVSAIPATVGSLIVGIAAAGATVKLHNCTTTGAAAAGNLVGTFATDAVNPVFIDAYFDVGIVVIVSGGTQSITITVG